MEQSRSQNSPELRIRGVKNWRRVSDLPPPPDHLVDVYYIKLQGVAGEGRKRGVGGESGAVGGWARMRKRSEGWGEWARLRGRVWVCAEGFDS